MYSSERLEFIYDRTDGRCHICRKKIHWSNYGLIYKHGAWEVDHSNPKANGGSNRLTNLFPACISCNRSKGSNSTRAARSKYGFTSSPKSKQKKEQRKERQSILILSIIFIAILRLFYIHNFIESK